MTSIHPIQWQPILRRCLKMSFLVGITLLLNACGGGSSSSSTSNAVVAAQAQDLQPTESTETVSVFVALDSSTVSGISSDTTELERRTQLQQQFLQSLQTKAAQAVSGASSSSTCTASDLATRISQAVAPVSGDAVRLDLTACELNLLSNISSVKGVYPDVPMTSFATASSAADTSKIVSAVLYSFNPKATAQPTIDGSTADGSSQVIAVLDTGVEERHPALGTSKVLVSNSACFSTSSNGGNGFCRDASGNTVTKAIPANTKTSDSTVATATDTSGRSCADQWSSTSTRSAAITAGCGHGTSMATAAAMSYSSSVKGIAPNAKILPVQVFTQSSTNSLSSSSGDLLAALEWLATEAARRKTAGENPIVAVNMSLGSDSSSSCSSGDTVGTLFKTAFTSLRTQGVLPVVAAGNSSSKTAISFPACIDGAVPVAASKLGYAGIASYSNFSSKVKLFAIGGDTDSKYSLPSLCTTTGTYDCWTSMAGTSPATALASGGVAALYSLKSTASLTDIETALTTNIAGLNLTNSSALNLTVNDGTTNYTVPAMRLTASGYYLKGLTEPSTTSTSPDVPSVTDSTSYAQICLYSLANYKGTKACAIQSYSNDSVSASKDLYYRFFGKVGSITLKDLSTSTALASSKATVTLYPSFSLSSGTSVSVSTSVLSSTAYIRVVRITTQ